jgi:hypothetical protein
MILYGLMSFLYTNEERRADATTIHWMTQKGTGSFLKNRNPIPDNMMIMRVVIIQNVRFDFMVIN